MACVSLGSLAAAGEVFAGCHRLEVLEPACPELLREVVRLPHRRAVIFGELGFPKLVLNNRAKKFLILAAKLFTAQDSGGHGCFSRFKFVGDGRQVEGVDSAH